MLGISIHLIVAQLEDRKEKRNPVVSVRSDHLKESYYTHF